MRSIIVYAAIGAFAAAATGCGRADYQATEPTPSLATPEQTSVAAPTEASSTGVFVNQMAAEVLVEIETSRVAATRAKDSNVRQFARTLIADGESTRRDVEQFAEELGAQLPALDAVASTAVAGVRLADASTVDEHYLNTIIEARAGAIDELERYAQSGESEDLRAWAQEILPTYRARLQEADTLRQSVNIAPS